MIEQFDELLKKFLKEGLGKEEGRLFATLFKNPECQLYLASKIDQELLDEQSPVEADEVIGKKVLQLLKDKIRENDEPDQEEGYAEVISMRSERRKLYRFAAVAASVVFVAVSVFLWKNRTENPDISKKTVSNYSLTGEHHEINTTGRDKKIQLSDNSLVILANNSELVYNEPFRNNRTIHLTGKAYFKVFKDKTSPFTVISGEISTTALGTEFTVTAFKSNSNVVVRLYEGKVVVRPVNKLDSKIKSEVYLLPGEEFVYGRDGVAKNKGYKKGALPIQVLSEEKFLDDPSLPENEKGSWYMFNDQSLGSVLDQLAALYNVQIVYNKKDIEQIYFTGKYERTESLDAILKRICAINNLNIIKKDAAYLISR